MKDIRRLDYDTNPGEGRIVLIRHHVALFCLDPIRAVVTSSRLILILPNEKHMKLATTMHEYMKGSDDNSRFEMQVYDTLLITMRTVNTEAYKKLRVRVENIIATFKKKIMVSYEMQERLRELKNDTARLQRQIGGTQDVLRGLVTDEERLSILNLTAVKESPELYKQALQHPSLHQDLENLFEAYLVDYNRLANNIRQLSAELNDVEVSASLRLDSSRNQIMSLTAILTIVSCCIGFCGYVSGIFGMNLDQTRWLQHVPGVFSGIIISTMLFMVIVSIVASATFVYLDIIPI
jgi:Mg2+ and Co2+ transporter CorA